MQYNKSVHAYLCRRELLTYLSLAVFWITGLGFGFYLSLNVSVSNLRAMYNVALYPLSFLRLFLVLIFPLLLSALLIQSSVFWLLPVVAFLKAMSFSCCSCGIMIAFASAGWLVRSLFFFSQSVSILLLIWFWIRHSGGQLKNFRSDLLISACLIFLICCIDYFAVSPFLEALLNI